MRHLIQHLANVSIDLSGIGTRGLLYIEHYTGMPVDVGAEIVGTGTEFHVGNITQT